MTRHTMNASFGFLFRKPNDAFIQFIHTAENGPLKDAPLEGEALSLEPLSLELLL